MIEEKIFCFNSKDKSIALCESIHSLMLIRVAQAYPCNQKARGTQKGPSQMVKSSSGHSCGEAKSANLVLKPFCTSLLTLWSHLACLSVNCPMNQK